MIFLGLLDPLLYRGDPFLDRLGSVLQPMGIEYLVLTDDTLILEDPADFNLGNRRVKVLVNGDPIDAHRC